MTYSPNNVISVKAVSKTFYPAPRWLRMLVKSPLESEILALDSVSLAVGAGEICALVGPNGAGKTTLFRILMGLTTPTGGSARILGHDVVTESLDIRRRVGWMPASERTLFDRHTCAENLRFHGRLYGLSGLRLEQRVSETLGMVGLGDAAQNAVVSFSAGMKARLQLARAVLHEPRVLILDEPTASVDPVAAYELIDLIVSIVREQGLAAIVSSHRLDEIETLRSHVILLHRGRVLFDGPLDELRSKIDRPHMEFQFSSTEAAHKAAILFEGMPDVELLDVEGYSVRAVMAYGIPLGKVVKELDGVLSDLVGAAEVSIPLRQVLADVYGVSEQTRDT